MPKKIITKKTSKNNKAAKSHKIFTSKKQIKKKNGNKKTKKNTKLYSKNYKNQNGGSIAQFKFTYDITLSDSLTLFSDQEGIINYKTTVEGDKTPASTFIKSAQTEDLKLSLTADFQSSTFLESLLAAFKQQVCQEGNHNILITNDYYKQIIRELIELINEKQPETQINLEEYISSCERTIASRQLVTQTESPYGVFIPSIKLLTDTENKKIAAADFDVLVIDIDTFITDKLDRLCSNDPQKSNKNTCLLSIDNEKEQLRTSLNTESNDTEILFKDYTYLIQLLSYFSEKEKLVLLTSNRLSRTVFKKFLTMFNKVRNEIVARLLRGNARDEDKNKYLFNAGVLKSFPTNYPFSFVDHYLVFPPNRNEFPIDDSNPLTGQAFVNEILEKIKRHYLRGETFSQENPEKILFIISNKTTGQYTIPTPKKDDLSYEIITTDVLSNKSGFPNSEANDDWSSSFQDPLFSY